MFPVKVSQAKCHDDGCGSGLSELGVAQATGVAWPVASARDEAVLVEEGAALLGHKETRTAGIGVIVGTWKSLSDSGPGGGGAA